MTRLSRSIPLPATALAPGACPWPMDSKVWMVFITDDDHSTFEGHVSGVDAGGWWPIITSASTSLARSHAAAMAEPYQTLVELIDEWGKHKWRGEPLPDGLFDLIHQLTKSQMGPQELVDRIQETYQ